jgi:hypothetical protein
MIERSERRYSSNRRGQHQGDHSGSPLQIGRGKHNRNTDRNDFV